ncbi:hypothetical protein JCM10213_003257 [Rhodosporidiobolus nylandii]
MAAEPTTQPSQLSPEAIAYAQQFFAAARQGLVDVLRAPLEAGLPVDLTNENGDTLLMLAAYHGNLEAVELLLKHGANPNSLNDRGQSPLAGAIFKSSDSIAQALLNAGANPDFGQPTAWQTCILFKTLPKWEEKFAEARRRRDEREAEAAREAGAEGQ